MKPFHMKSGVISFILPRDISNSFEYFNDNHYYIKAVSKNRADQFSLIKAVHNNGISLSEIVPEDITTGSTPEIEPNSVQELENSVPGL